QSLSRVGLLVDCILRQWHHEPLGREEENRVSSKRTTGLWHAGILALGLVAGCGRSDSHHEPGVEPSSATGGAGDESHDGGATAITGGPVARSGGAGGPSAG